MKQYMIYGYGANLDFYDDNDIVEVKIGMYSISTINTKQRYFEHVSHNPQDTIWFEVESDTSDGYVRDSIDEYNNNHHNGSLVKRLYKPTYNGKKRLSEVYEIKKLNAPILIDVTKRIVNKQSTGISHANSYPMRLEQEVAKNTIVSYFNNTGNSFLVNAKMRFGKTHVALSVIMEMDFRTTLIVSYRPNDIVESWLKSSDHRDFDFDVCLFENRKSNANNRKVYFASYQYMLLHEEEFIDLKPDMIIHDESHHGTDTERARNIVDKLNAEYNLYLSGTPLKDLNRGKFDQSNTYTWSYTDEQCVRQKEIDEFGEDKCKKLNHSECHYWQVPMELYGIKIGEAVKKLVDEKCGGKEEKESEFINKTAVKRFLDNLTNGNMPYSDTCEYDTDLLTHTQWLMPGVKSCEAMAKSLRSHPYFKKYRVLVAAGNDEGFGASRSNESRIKEYIESIESGEKISGIRYIGTITLSCGKLTHGISVPEWGATFQLHDGLSAERYFQSLFRAQTARPNHKYKCYAFDFNPNRMLRVSYTYSNPNNESIEKVKSKLEILLKHMKIMILSQDDNSFQTVDVNMIEKSVVSINGSFYDSVVLDIDFDDNQDEVFSELEDIQYGKIGKIEVRIGDGGIDKTTRHRVKDGSDEDLNDELDDESKKKINKEEHILKMKEAKKKIPILVYLSDKKYNTLKEIVENHTNEICKLATGISRELLLSILSNQRSDIIEDLNLMVQNKKNTFEQIEIDELFSNI